MAARCPCHRRWRLAALAHRPPMYTRPASIRYRPPLPPGGEGRHRPSGQALWRVGECLTLAQAAIRSKVERMNQRRGFDSALRTLGRAFVHVRWPAEATDPDAALERSAVAAPHPRARTRRAPRSLQATRLPRRSLLYRLGLLLMALLFLMKTPHPGLAHSQPLGRTASSAPAGSSFGSVA